MSMHYYRGATLSNISTITTSLPNNKIAFYHVLSLDYFSIKSEIFHLRKRYIFFLSINAYGFNCIFNSIYFSFLPSSFQFLNIIIFIIIQSMNITIIIKKNNNNKIYYIYYIHKTQELIQSNIYHFKILQNYTSSKKNPSQYA